MRKIFILFAITLIMTNCTKNYKVDKETRIKELKLNREKTQVELNKINEELGTLENKKDEIILVSVETIKNRSFSHFIEIQGNINTKENILIQPEMPGTLVSLNAKSGQKVSKGQVLGKVDDYGMSSQLASVENQATLAKTAFERQKNLWNQKIGSEIQFLQAQTQMISAQKSVLQMRSQLNKTIIKAPFSGTIDEIFVERGQVVAPSAQGLMRIVNLSNMYVSTAVPESYVGKLKIGSVVNVSLESLGKNYIGKVRQIANNINPANRSFGIEVAVPNKDNLLRPNQVAKLQIIDYTIKNAIVVPTNIIQEDGSKNKFLYTVTNINGNSGIAKKVIIKPGQSAENVTEILKGISVNDMVITEGINTLFDGMKVQF